MSQPASLRICPRCGTPVQPGGSVCEHCELPLEGPARVRYNPAGLALPSPVQGHATVLVGVIAAVLLLVAGAWFLNHGVGPFRAVVVNRTIEAGSQGSQGTQVTVVDLRVRNDGSRSGRARCRLSGVKPDGSLVNSGVQLTQSIQGHGQIDFRLRGTGMHDAHDVSATCS